MKPCSFRLSNNHWYDELWSFPVKLPIKFLLHQRLRLEIHEGVLWDLSLIWWSYTKISAKNSLLAEICHKVAQLLSIDVKSWIWQDFNRKYCPINLVFLNRWHWHITGFKIRQVSIWKSEMKLISCLTTLGLCHGEEKQNIADPLQKKLVNQLSRYSLRNTYGEYRYQEMGKRSFASAEALCKTHNGHLPIPRSGKIWQIEMKLVWILEL